MFDSLSSASSRSDVTGTVISDGSEFSLSSSEAEQARGASRRLVWIPWISLVLLFASGPAWSVQVLDAESGAPISGAVVSVSEARALGALSEVARQSSDASGLVDVPSVIGVGVVEVRAPGYVMVQYRFSGVSTQSVPDSVRLRRGRIVAGTVEGPTGPVSECWVAIHSGFWARPVGRHSVRTSPSLGSGHHGTQSFDRGRFEVTVPDGSFALEVGAPGLAPRILGPFGEDRAMPSDLTVPLQGGFRAEGVVFDQEGRPLTNAAVSARLFIPDGSAESLFHSYHGLIKTRTGPDGRFQLDGLPSRIVVLQVTDDRILPIQERIDGSLTGIQLQARPGQWIEGRFLGLSSQGARLVDPRGKKVLAKLRTAEDGTFRSQAFPLRAEEALIDVPGFRPALVTWASGPGGHHVGEIAPQPGRTIVIDVLNPQGGAIEGARVDLFAAQRGWVIPRRFLVGGRTDAEGRVELDGLAEGRHFYRVSHPGYVGETQDFEESELVLTLARRALLSGRVVDTEGNPVVGAQVHSVTTGEDGSFEFDGFSSLGTGKLTVTAKGFVPVKVEIGPFEVGGSTELETITLSRAPRISGWVRDSSGKPIPGARVHGAQRIALAREDGSFELEVPDFRAHKSTEFSRSLLSVYAFCPGYVDSAPVKFEFGGEDPAPVEFVLEPARTLGGRVADRYGVGVPSARVRLENRDTGTYLSTSTNYDGEFSFERVPETDVVIHASAAGYRTRSRAVDSLESDCEIILDQGARLVVRLTPDETGELPDSIRFQQSYGGSGVRVPSGRGLSDHEVVDGVVRLTGLSAGDLRFRVSAMGFATTDVVETALVLNEEAVVEVPLSRSGPVRTIRVLDPLGNPIAGASVEIGDSDTVVDSGTTDDDGRFGSSRVGGAFFQARVWAQGFANATVHQILPKFVEGLLEVTLVPGGSVSVRVVDDEGQPVAGITAIVPARGLRDPKWATTRADGRAGFFGVPAGAHSLSFRMPPERPGRNWFGPPSGKKLGSSRVEVLPGADVECVFRIPQKVEIEGVVRINGSPVDRGVVRWRDVEAAVDEEGRFRLEMLTGQQTLRFEQANVVLRHDVLVELDSLEVSLNLRAAPLTLTILRSDGRPLAGATVSLNRRRYELDEAGSFEFPLLPLGTTRVALNQTPEGRALLGTPLVVGRDREATFWLVPIRKVKAARLTALKEQDLALFVEVLFVGDDGRFARVRRDSEDRLAYAVPNLPGQLLVLVPGRAPKLCEIPSEGSELKYRPTPGGELEVEVVGPKGLPRLAHIEIVSTETMQTPRALLEHWGTRSRVNLPSGEVEVRCSIDLSDVGVGEEAGEHQEIVEKIRVVPETTTLLTIKVGSSSD